jgi:hypothetical protein
LISKNEAEKFPAPWRKGHEFCPGGPGGLKIENNIGTFRFFDFEIFVRVFFTIWFASG